MRLAGLLVTSMISIAATGLYAQTVTGSGTAGTVPVFTGSGTSSSIGNSGAPISVSGSNVGIGTTSPLSALQIGAINSGTDKLSIPGWYNFENIYLGQYGNGDGALEFLNHIDTAHSYGAKLLTSSDTGVNGLQFQLAPGTTSYGTLSYSTAMTILAANGNVGIGTTTPGASLEVKGNIKLTSGSGASMTFQDGTIQSTAWTGTLCGGDYAEAMSGAGGKSKYEPGDVLVLTEDGKQDVAKSSGPYSTMVAGIYATKPGVIGRRRSLVGDDSELPMAMVGVVPTKVTDENGPIHRGDLLVSSSKAGYAMKGTDRSRMLGAVIGKAMGSLDSGTGEIEVLVTLQ